jgi:hypothetical protein
VGAGIAQSVYRLATGWKVRGSNPGGARFSAPIQTGSGTHPASCTMGTGSFPGVKTAGRDADHTPASSAEVKKELSCTSTHPLGPPGPVTGFPLLEEGEGLASRPGRNLPPGKTRYPLYRRLGGPQGRSGQVRKISSHRDSIPGPSSQ